MTVRILVGDALDRLRELPDNSVHCVVTSPPYWGLRAYQGEDGMIGLEETFDEHLNNLLAVFRDGVSSYGLRCGTMVSSHKERAHEPDPDIHPLPRPGSLH